MVISSLVLIVALSVFPLDSIYNNSDHFDTSGVKEIEDFVLVTAARQNFKGKREDSLHNRGVVGVREILHVNTH